MNDKRILLGGLFVSHKDNIVKTECAKHFVVVFPPFNFFNAKTRRIQKNTTRRQVLGVI